MRYFPELDLTIDLPVELFCGNPDGSLCRVGDIHDFCPYCKHFRALDIPKIIDKELRKKGCNIQV